MFTNPFAVIIVLIVVGIVNGMILVVVSVWRDFSISWIKVTGSCVALALIAFELIKAFVMIEYPNPYVVVTPAALLLITVVFADRVTAVVRRLIQPRKKPNYPN